MSVPSPKEEKFTAQQRELVDNMITLLDTFREEGQTGRLSITVNFGQGGITSWEKEITTRHR